MVKIKIVFLYYFIEFAHTDDFPSKGTRLVVLMLCVIICLSLFRIPIICEHLLVILYEGFFQFKFESSVNPIN